LFFFCQISIFEMIKERSTALLVIASDGIWDVMSPQQVVDLLDQHSNSHHLHEQLMDDGQQTKSPIHQSIQQLAQSLSQHLVDGAFGIKKNNDDVTAVVAALSLDPFPQTSGRPMAHPEYRISTKDGELLPPVLGAHAYS
jgi:serine/threonine protein phosphatase PrpC